MRRFFNHFLLVHQKIVSYLIVHPDNRDFLDDEINNAADLTRQNNVADLLQCNKDPRITSQDNDSRSINLNNEDNNSEKWDFVAPRPHCYLTYAQFKLRTQ